MTVIQTLVDGRTGNRITDLFDHTDPIIVKATMKDGLRVFDGTDTSILAVDRGLGGDLSTDVGPGECGEHITMIFPRRASFSNLDVFNKFISQFKVLENSIPTSYDSLDGVNTSGNSVVIDSEDFTALDGIFRYYDDSEPEFNGSTFKVGPKIYSAETMKDIRVYGDPYDDYRGSDFRPWKPFEDCPNLESIENQGTFEKIEHLGPVDLTYEDEDGFIVLSAYPSGGSPITIDGYVTCAVYSGDLLEPYAVSGKIRSSERFPSFETDRLKVCSNHFLIKEVVIDSTSNPALPLGGLSFEGAEMDVLIMPEVNLKIDFPMQDPTMMNFSFSWSHLGVVAPKSVKTLAHLHSIFLNTSDESAQCNIATPNYLKTNVSFSWGNNLEEFSKENEGKFTEDWMPLVPEGIEKSYGHYYRIKLEKEGEDASVWEKKFMRSVKDGEDYTYVVQPLPPRTNDDYVIVNYCRNLYANLEISNDITIPAIPDGPIAYSRDCYRRTFFNTVGPKQPIGAPTEKKIQIAWAKSSWDHKFHQEEDFEIVLNIDKDYRGPFRDYMNMIPPDVDGFSKTVLNFLSLIDDGIVTPEQIEYMRQLWRDIAVTGYSNNGRTYNGIEDFDTFDKLIDGINEYPVGEYSKRTIQNKIELQAGNHSFIQFAGGWQRECFYGAAVDPTVSETLIIPTDQAVERDEYSYYRALDVNHIFPDTATSYIWKGYLTLYGDEQLEEGETYNTILGKTHRLRFTAILTSNEPEMDDLREEGAFNLSEITQTLSPRQESPPDQVYGVKKPYHGAFNSKVIYGDYEEFMSRHGIVLQNPSLFWRSNESPYYQDNSGNWTRLIDYDGFPTIGMIGFNVQIEFVPSGWFEVGGYTDHFFIFQRYGIDVMKSEMNEEGLYNPGNKFKTIWLYEKDLSRQANNTIVKIRDYPDGQYDLFNLEHSVNEGFYLLPPNIME